MKAIFQKALAFIKENPSMMYSLLLVVIIPIMFFVSTYLVNLNYEKNIDKITQRKAQLVESALNESIQKTIKDQDALQRMIDKVVRENSEEIISLSVIEPSQDDAFAVIASSSPDRIGLDQSHVLQNTIAWSKTGEGIAFLDADSEQRFWTVTQVLLDDAGEKMALVSMDFSLKNTDALIDNTIRKSYWILVSMVLIVVLLVSNHARLFGYAISLSKLKEVDKMKDMFISMAGHELRTPLTAIRGYVDLLKGKAEISGDKENSDFVTKICLSIDRLQNLINDILEVSRLEGNRLPMKITSFDPNPIVTQTVEEVMVKAQEKNITLSYTPLSDSILLQADEERFKQVLVNLIGNSIKYTEKGSVTIMGKVKDGELALTIADTGIGISSENVAKLFQKFYRVQSDRTRGIVGTGLGLWITMEITKRMKGRIAVESIEGVGSHFTVYLPCTASHNQNG